MEVKPQDQPAQKSEKKLVEAPRNTPEIQQAKRDLKKLEEQLSKIEKEIESLELLKGETEEKMTDPEIYTDESKAQKIQESYQDIQNSLYEANAKWENLVEEISRLQEITAA